MCDLDLSTLNFKSMKRGLLFIRIMHTSIQFDCPSCMKFTRYNNNVQSVTFNTNRRRPVMKIKNFLIYIVDSNILLLHLCEIWQIWLSFLKLQSILRHTSTKNVYRENNIGLPEHRKKTNSTCIM